MTSGAGRTHRRATLRLAALPLVGLLLTACSAGDPASTVNPSVAQLATGAAASQSRSAELHAGLTHALVERVYVTAAAGDAVVASTGRADPMAAEASRLTLDASSQALASVLGATYDAARAPLLVALRDADRLHLELALARSAGDAVAVATARAALEQAQLELSAVLRRVVPGLRAERVRDRLMPDLEAQLAAEGVDPYPALRVAAGRARDTGHVLAGGISDDRRLGVSGTRASRLRADLTALLTEHALLAGGLAGELATPDAAAAAGARAALEANAVELSQVLGRGHPALLEPFLRQWRAYLIQLDSHAQTVATGAAEENTLRDFAGILADLIAQHVDGLPADRIRAELAPALDASLRAVDIAALRGPGVPAELRRAAAAAPAPAALLAAGIAEDLRLR